MNGIEFVVFKLKEKKGELGMELVLGIAIAIIIAGFILIPGLRTFSQTVLTSMTEWWNGTIKTNVFPAS